MNKFYTRFLLILSKVTGNIAFYPSLIALFGLALGLLILQIDTNVSKYLSDRTPLLVINDADTARTMLSTFIGGNISLMVFSFSMVMLLLNKASSSYSPRILPGLIANKRHQRILGFYIAVILYTIIILLSIKPTTNSRELPAFAILVGIFLSIGVLAAFIYFIHSISQSIQINNIIDRIYNIAKGRLDDLIDEDDVTDDEGIFDDTDEWNRIIADRTGHLNEIALDSLTKFATENDCLIKVLVHKGTFILGEMPLAAVDTELNEEQKNDLLYCFSFSKNEIVDNNYVLSFKQLTEIAVKAMSPGINDPGTAVTCLNYLTQLFALRLKKKDDIFMKNKDGKVLIALTTIAFNDLLYFVFSSLRQYCKHDFIITYKMISLLKTVSHTDFKNEYYSSALKLQKKLVMMDAENGIENKEDLKRLQMLSESFL